MGTRSRIALQTKKTLRSIYVHWDGHPSHHAPILLGHYNTPDSVATLIGLGDMSALSRDMSICQPYNDSPATTHPDLEHLIDWSADCNAEYTYLFTKGKWQICEPGGGWQDLYLRYVTERIIA